MKSSHKPEPPNTRGWFSQLHWTHTFEIVSLHICGVFGLWFWPRPLDLALFLGLYLSTTFAIGMGNHRLLTHRSFVAPRWMRRMLAWAGAAALFGGPARWVAIHRRHHQTADHHGDPHSPLRGFFHAHVGWILQRDTEEEVDYRDLVPDVSGQDPWMRVLDGKILFVLPWCLTALLSYAIGGWRGVLWGTVLRTLALWHVTWSINSFGHIIGKRHHETPDESHNVWWLSVLTLGEGWHNNHHARPAAAIQGWRWYELDLTGYVIRFVARLGLISNVVPPPAWSQPRRLHGD